MSPSDQRFERRLEAALHDLPTPDGLRERLLAAVVGPAETAVRGAPAADPSPVAERSPVAEPSRVAGLARARRWPRQRLFAGAFAASVFLAAMAWWGFGSGGDSQADVASLAAGWAPRLSGAWKPMSSAPAGYAVDSLRSAPQGWQWATKVVGHVAVAFDVSRPRLRAALFAIRMPAPQLSFGPPATPQFTTGGQAIAAWRSAGLVYVLVVDGDEQGYRGLIRGTAAPLAWTPAAGARPSGAGKILTPRPRAWAAA